MKPLEYIIATVKTALSAAFDVKSGNGKTQEDFDNSEVSTTPAAFVSYNGFLKGANPPRDYSNMGEEYSVFLRVEASDDIRAHAIALVNEFTKTNVRVFSNEDEQEMNITISAGRSTVRNGFQIMEITVEVA